VTPAAEVSADVRKRLYELMVLMKAADDRLSKGIGTGEFMCVYWPSRGQEAIAAAMGVALRTDAPRGRVGARAAPCTSPNRRTG
jgi:acetoin:2,6-dichlorophenolindophenol oxidoreductase subunit alpha